MMIPKWLLFMLALIAVPPAIIVTAYFYVVTLMHIFSSDA